MSRLWEIKTHRVVCLRGTKAVVNQQETAQDQELQVWLLVLGGRKLVLSNLLPILLLPSMASGCMKRLPVTSCQQREGFYIILLIFYIIKLYFTSYILLLWSPKHCVLPIVAPAIHSLKLETAVSHGCIFLGLTGALGLMALPSAPVETIGF